MSDSHIHIETSWRVAKLEDFFNGIPINCPGHKRMIGRPFLVRNQKGDLEMYQLTESSDPQRIFLWIQQGNIYVMNRENFADIRPGSSYYTKQKEK